MKKLLLLGANGQLGRTFLSHFRDSDLAGKYFLRAVDIDEVDLTRKEPILSFLSSYEPSLIINCAAYTAVDVAETEFELAKKINDEAVGSLSAWASSNLCRMLHISTDFVFDGSKKEPYLPTDQASPIGVYGKTKLAGEKHILKSLSGGVVVRTSWLYSEFGQNFVKSMIRLMTEKPELSIISDQIGSPTSTHSLVHLLFQLVEHDSFSGILHWCDGASISWYDFAVEIQRQAFERGLLTGAIPLKPITTEEYPTLAARPCYSVLDRGDTLQQFDINALDWRAELGKVINRISESSGG
ncbi:MAG: dTDP-4-dehydrorhamnose reductase [Flammeovirgaceae bacterium TMED32]|nr:MAG: dTDP-4-dehydrorhamnose reductase [Flammeovirgaceae bacterium TMED32]|tara:strand:- start:2514 stop:3407 length:894 start_codon:yes stop_codon:yes gene_type:complete